MILLALALAQAPLTDETATRERDAKIAALSSCRIQTLASSPMSTPFSNSEAAWQQVVGVLMKVAQQRLETAETEEAKAVYQAQVDAAQKCLVLGESVTFTAPAEKPEQETQTVN
jgi:hypothetical protein